MRKPGSGRLRKTLERTNRIKRYVLNNRLCYSDDVTNDLNLNISDRTVRRRIGKSFKSSDRCTKIILTEDHK